MTPGGANALGVVIVAAGSGQRFGSADKVFSLLRGKPVLQYSLDLFLTLPDVRQVVVVLGSHTLEDGRNLVANRNADVACVCLGGATRSDSVRAGLRELDSAIDLVAIHDAARPLVQQDMVQRVVASARRSGAAIPAISVSDTIQRVGSDGRVVAIELREGLRAAQTPQVARRDWLNTALERGDNVTDEASALFAAGFPVMTVEGCAENMKLTWPGDLAIAEAILKRRGQ